jgi:hypothetical protein
MKSIFIANRCVYPDKEQLMGVFSNKESAEACASDSLYPNRGTVLEIDLSNIQDNYEKISSYESWERESVKTTYILADNSFSPPAHWSRSLAIEVLRREDTDDLEEPEDVYSGSEHLLIAKMAFLMSEEFTKVVAIRDRIPGASAFIMLGDFPHTVATGWGFKDRGELLTLSYHAIRIIYLSENFSLESYNQAECLFSSFWRHFVDATSNGPKDWAAPWY